MNISVTFIRGWTCTSLSLLKYYPMLMGIRSKRAIKECTITWFIILAFAIGLQPSNNTLSTSPRWTRLSSRLNQEMAPTQTLTQLCKLNLGKWTSRKEVQLAQLAQPKTTVWPTITVARWVISLTIAQTVTWWWSYSNKLRLAKIPQKPSLDAHIKTRKEEVHQLVERRVDSLPRWKRLSSRQTVRKGASWRVFRTRTLRQDKATEVSGRGCTSLKNTILCGIVKWKGWQIGAR